MRLETVLTYGAALAVAGTVLLSCGKATSVDIEETAQQVGDVMASIDESGGSSGSLSAMLFRERKTFARLAPGTMNPSWESQILGTSAEAAGCRDTFSACVGTVMTRTFAGCLIGATTFTGTVVLTWGDGAYACQITANNHSITRVPNFTVTGRRGATLTVTKSGTVGQKITRSSGTTFKFSNDGINRKFALGSTTLFDFTTKTTEDITITGAGRSTRVLSGGKLEVTDNKSNTTCTIVPTAVTWNASCTCAVSGSWAGTCSDSKAYKLEMTGCGTGTLTLGTELQTLTFDRCESTT